MNSPIDEIAKLLKCSFQRKLTIFGGALSFLYFLRWVLSRNIPSMPELPPKSSTDTTFIRQLLKLIPIAIPSYTSKEALYAYTLSALLILRTLLSIFVSTLNGKLLKCLITNNKQSFIRRVIPT